MSILTQNQDFRFGEYLKSAEKKLNEYEINIVMQSPVVANKLIPETAYFSHAWTHCSSLTDKKNVYGLCQTKLLNVLMLELDWIF